MIKHLQLFNTILGINWEPSNDVVKELNKAGESLQNTATRSNTIRKEYIISEINKKFGLNNEVFQKILDFVAKNKILFNYHQKQSIREFLDFNKVKDFSIWIENRPNINGFKKDLMELFNPVSKGETLKYLVEQIKDKKLANSILESLFGAFIFYSYDTEKMHKIFNSELKKTNKYYKDYFIHLKHFYPAQIDRKHAATLIEVNNKFKNKFKTDSSFRNSLFTQIQNEYKRLNNHCYLFIILRGDLLEQQWDLYSDIVLFSEKFIETKLIKGYFKPKLIEKVTSEYTNNFDSESTRFDIANEGFTYEDCYILNSPSVNHYDLLTTLVKNQRDETPIPCPACRSNNVQGNSYPIIGVRSWECNNLICPDRSKYNRGKRYALSSIIKQEALENENNVISKEFLKKWKFDISNINSDKDYLEMICRNYTLWGDKIKLVNTKNYGVKLFGRNIEYETLEGGVDENLYNQFFNSSFFKRFLLEKENTRVSKLENLSKIDKVDVFCGDAFEVLNSLPKKSIDGAVTSPPYYNARDYSQWANIYNYLYDMFNIIKSVEKVLKEGSVFVFNIFDYFDNENIIVQSAMGKKRMILGAYIIYLFKKAGFSIVKNVIWDKGEIEGKRNFNQGNFSPYYQRPFNSWEHVFIFVKGKADYKTIKNINNLPSILHQKPVLKLFNGRNILGHTAPFPKAMPEILLRLLDKKSTVLDPFSGSMTSGRVAYQAGSKSTNIDYKIEYCELGLKILKSEISQ